ARNPKDKRGKKEASCCSGAAAAAARQGKGNGHEGAAAADQQSRNSLQVGPKCRSRGPRGAPEARRL
ncbi:hypothetical protein ETH_00033695, partial [Eimeria tenella]